MNQQIFENKCKLDTNSVLEKRSAFAILNSIKIGLAEFDIIGRNSVKNENHRYVIDSVLAQLSTDERISDIKLDFNKNFIYYKLNNYPQTLQLTFTK